jgi:D-alanyl-lipoteichoic acid acyltransferase DltB (MBOAT superfamily)
MLFNSYAFLFAFLPLSLLGYYLAGKLGKTAAIAWLALCSLTFYGMWNASFLVLLVSSICFNYAIGTAVGRSEEGRKKQYLFAFGVAANLAVLAFYKYLGPLVGFLQYYGLITSRAHLDIILPLGISFFTFTQIGYLVDRRDGLGENLDFLRYTVFVTFFPHLIAGPILHIREIGPQLLDRCVLRLKAECVAPGLAMFAIGLSKKVLLADPLSDVVAAGFGHSAAIALVPAWIAAAAYTLQLYFDFSGYSDMAIGIARMFGIKFPLNFDSPYKTRGAIEFWQRWHMTLSRYLGLLLYNPVAMRITRWRVAHGQKISHKALATPSAFFTMIMVPIFYTMALAGIWHGAGLQFLIFGLLNAFYLSANHAWRVFLPQNKKALPRRETVVLQVLLTYMAWTVSLVFFRSATCTEALHLLSGMAGLRGIGIPLHMVGALNKLGHAGRWIAQHTAKDDPLHIASLQTIVRLIATFAVVWAAPNSQQIMAAFSPVLEEIREPAPVRMQWRPNMAWGLVIGGLLCIDVMSFRQTSVFLYFQF